MLHADYRASIQRVLAYIDKHLDEKLTLKSLSKVARISQFHFHRIFSGYMGVSLGQYIKNKRIEIGLRELSNTNSKIIDIAMSAGYETHASFNKVFKEKIGLSPKEFKKTTKEKGNYMIHLEKNNVEFLGYKNLEDEKILFIRKTGSYFVSPKSAWEHLLSELDKYGMKTMENKYIGISHDNPHDKDVNEEDLRFDACVVENDEIQKIATRLKKEGLQEGKILGGRYAVFLHKGPYEKLGESYHYIYGHWLYKEDKKIRNAPPFIKYRQLLSLTNLDPKDLEVEIFIPIK